MLTHVHKLGKRFGPTIVGLCGEWIVFLRFMPIFMKRACVLTYTYTPHHSHKEERAWIPIHIDLETLNSPCYLEEIHGITYWSKYNNFNIWHHWPLNDPTFIGYTKPRTIEARDHPSYDQFETVGVGRWSTFIQNLGMNTIYKFMFMIEVVMSHLRTP